MVLAGIVFIFRCCLMKLRFLVLKLVCFFGVLWVMLLRLLVVVNVLNCWCDLENVIVF